jgi:hypothetical protein
MHHGRSNLAEFAVEHDDLGDDVSHGTDANASEFPVNGESPLLDVWGGDILGNDHTAEKYAQLIGEGGWGRHRGAAGCFNHNDVPQTDTLSSHDVQGTSVHWRVANVAELGIDSLDFAQKDGDREDADVSQFPCDRIDPGLLVATVWLSKMGDPGKKGVHLCVAGNRGCRGECVDSKGTVGAWLQGWYCIGEETQRSVGMGI